MTEMEKLAEMLKKNYVPFAVAVNGLTKTPQILYPNDRNPIFSIVCHQYSEGGKEGLLELMDCRDDNIDEEGYLTAEQVSDRISEDRAKALGRIFHKFAE